MTKKPRIIIFDGVDKAGKSTTVDKIAEVFPTYKVLKGLSSKNIADFKRDSGKLVKEIYEALDTHEGVIVDRVHILSDPIYNPVIWKQPLTEEAVQYLEYYVELQKEYETLSSLFGTIVFIFTAQAPVILERMAAMGGPEDKLEERVKNNVHHYLKGYDSVYTSYMTGDEVMTNMFNNMILVDTTTLAPTKVANAVAAAIRGEDEIPYAQHLRDYIAYTSKYGDRKEDLMVAPIVPKSYGSHATGPFNLVLAQNLDKQEYLNMWRDCFGYKVLDNGAFELGESLPFGDVLRKAVTIAAQEVVLPDKFRDAYETIKMAKRGLQTYRKLRKHGVIPAGMRFKFMAVPQGNTLQEWLDSYKALGAMARVNVIAINRDSAKFFGTREGLLQYLDERRMIFPDKEYHLLGMQDTIGEIKVVQNTYPWVRSMDSCFPYLIGRDIHSKVLGKEIVEELFDKNIHRKEFKSTIDFEAITTDEEIKSFVDVLLKIREEGVIV